MSVISTMPPPAADGVLRLRVTAGERLVLSALAPHSIVTMLAVDALDPTVALSMYTSQAVNGRWQLSTGDLLMDTESRPAWQIQQDVGGQHYAGGGYCRRLFSAVDGTFVCTDLVAEAAVALGLRAYDLGPDTGFSVFAEPTYDPDGHWRVDPSGAPGREVVLRAERDQEVVLFSCPDHDEHPPGQSWAASVLAAEESAS